MPSERHFPKSAVRFETDPVTQEERGIISLDGGQEANLPAAVFSEAETRFIIRNKRALAKLRRQEVPAKRGSKSNRGKTTKRTSVRR